MRTREIVVVTGMALGFAGLVASADPARAGAWSLSQPVVVMEGGGSEVGTALPVAWEDIEQTLAWTPLPIEEMFLCLAPAASACTIDSNDILFFSFEASGVGLLEGDAVGATFTAAAPGAIANGSGFLLEMPDDPNTADPSGQLNCAQGRCLTFDDMLPGPGDRTAILLVSFGLGEIDNQLANTANQTIAIRLDRFQSGSSTPFTPIAIPEPAAVPGGVSILAALALLRRQARMARDMDHRRSSC